MDNRWKNNKNKNKNGKRYNEDEDNELKEKLIKYIAEPNWKEYMESYGNYKYKELEKAWGIKMNQLRKFFEILANLDDELKKSNIENQKIYKQLVQLIILTKDATSRGNAKEPFYKFMKEAINKVVEKDNELEQRIKNFYVIMEGLVALFKNN